MSGFVEIESPPTGEEEPPPERIECYVLTNIEPRCCGPLARDLNFILPLRCDDTSRAPSSSQPSRIANEYASADEFPRTDHLKRIRRRPATEEEMRARSKPDDAAQEQSTQSNNSDAIQTDNGNDKRTKEDATEQHPKKRPKPNKKRKKQDAAPWSLDMLVGSVAAVDRNINAFDATSPQSLAFILAKYNLSPESNNFVSRLLPGRPAHTKEELDQWNQSVWPTLFFEEKTAQYKEEQKALTLEEVGMMKRGMQDAIDDAIAGREQWKQWKKRANNSTDAEGMDIAGVVVMDPGNSSVVSRASEERQLQGMPDAKESTGQPWMSFPDEANPLCTPTLLAIQGVSRKEREVALDSGMESKEFKSGQYLCTGYDVYLTKEPNAYEAMALVHSRVRRVVFGSQDPGMGGLGGAATAGIHSLPGTNHHYRAFRLKMDKANDGDGRLQKVVESLRKHHGDATS